ncbi:unnamed protein product [Rangifer tarandus platyrhynchus]|uniref:Uncharacterized protein n=2 Tax=Rangifer tarandus platyrhynchus TaxID=3082113 RepID=A0ACB0FAD5_RANTA|nr:unnamed protein product [Rangifer tarandus platyrhynchus]CAI9709871.1 unnamed protein product [Rangifer tarandus platyrhynchus]
MYLTISVAPLAWDCNELPMPCDKLRRTAVSGGLKTLEFFANGEPSPFAVRVKERDSEPTAGFVFLRVSASPFYSTSTACREEEQFASLLPTRLASKINKSYNKRGAKATCCAFEKPPRAQAFRAADAGLARSGLRNPARALGARAAPKKDKLLEYPVTVVTAKKILLKFEEVS